MNGEWRGLVQFAHFAESRFSCPADDLHDDSTVIRTNEERTPCCIH